MTAPLTICDPAAWKSKFMPKPDHEYTFDVTLLTSLRVHAVSPEQAKVKLAKLIEWAGLLIGCNIDVEGAELSEIDGETA